MEKIYPRIAIVTGATSGIGEATARKFVVEGFGVVGSGRRAEKLKALEHEFGKAFCGVAGDVSDDAVIEKLLTQTVDHFGRPADIIVANAGRGLGGSVKDADLSQFEEVFKLNVSSALSLIQKAAQYMVDEKKNNAQLPADIVVVGSVVGRHISPFSAVYGSTKFAVRGLTEGLRREIGPKGVRVTLVEPGIVISGFQDAAGYSPDLVKNFKERFGQLLVGEDLANAIHFVVAQPPHVHVSNIMVRPTGQDYP